MTDAEQRLIDAVLLWQRCGYPQDRINQLAGIRDAASSLARERLPEDINTLFEDLVKAKIALPRDDYSFDEWDRIWDDAYMSWLAEKGEVPYRHFVPNENHAPFVTYFAVRDKISRLHIPPHLYLELYDGAKTKLGYEEP